VCSRFTGNDARVAGGLRNLSGKGKERGGLLRKRRRVPAKAQNSSVLHGTERPKLALGRMTKQGCTLSDLCRAGTLGLRTMAMVTILKVSGQIWTNLHPFPVRLPLSSQDAPVLAPVQVLKNPKAGGHISFGELRKAS
jgi:hypothetical protein